MYDVYIIFFYLTVKLSLMRLISVLDDHMATMLVGPLACAKRVRALRRLCLQSLHTFLSVICKRNDKLSKVA